LSKDFNPILQFGGATMPNSLLCWAARNGRPQLLVAMGHLDALRATDLANLFVNNRTIEEKIQTLSSSIITQG
jgi:hypothetical protein